MSLEIKEQPPAYRFEWDENKNRQNIRKLVLTLQMRKRCFTASFSSLQTCEKTTEKAAGLESARLVDALRSWSSQSADQRPFVSSP